MLFERWTCVKVLKQWMPKFLPKRDLNYNVKLVNFLGLNVIENPDKTQLTSSSFSIPLKFAFSLLMTFFSLLSGALCISFSRYSPFYLSLFPISFTLLLPYSAYFSVLSNSLSRSSRLVLRLSLLALISHSVSFFHSKPFLHELVSSGWQSVSSAGIVALQVDNKLQNTENYYSTTTSPVWFPAQNADCKLNG